MYREISDERIAQLDREICERRVARKALRAAIDTIRARESASRSTRVRVATWGAYAGMWAGAVGYCGTLRLWVFPLVIAVGALLPVAISVARSFTRRSRATAVSRRLGA